MVTHSGTAPGAGPFYRPVNLPRATGVHSDDRGLPLAVAPHPGRQIPVRALLDVWELDDEWWRDEPIRRRYFQLLLASGQLLTVFCDLVSGRWYQQSY